MRVIPGLLLLGCLAQCSAAEKTPRWSRRPAAPQRTAPDRPSGPPPLPARQVALVPGEAFGPYLVTAERRHVVVWAVTNSGSRRENAWYSSLALERGTPSAPRRLADASPDLKLVAVRRAEPDGFIVLSTRELPTGDTVQAFLLGEDGELRRNIRLASDRPPVVWLGAFRGAEATSVVWAERGSKGARLALAVVAPDGRTRPEQELAADVVAWQVVDTANGLAVALLTGGADSGRVEVVTRSASGALRRALVGEVRDASPDIDLVSVGDKLLLGWTSRAAEQPHVTLAVVDSGGTVLVPPKVSRRSLGGEALVELVPPAKPHGPAYVVYESLGERPAEGRAVTVARVAPDATLAERATLSVGSPDQLPEIEATDSGVAALTLAPACPRAAPPAGAPTGARDCSPISPMFVELGPSLDVVAAEPLRLKPLDGAAALAAWDLDCGSGRCVSLAAVPTAPAPVFLVDLEARSSAWESPAVRAQPELPPRAVALETLATLDSVSDLAAARVKDAVLCAWVTYFDPSVPWERPSKPAPDGRFAPVRAIVGAASIAEGQLSAPQTVSYRAHSLGGVSLASEPSSNEALLAWTALDNGAPQVFLTSLDSRARRVKQRMLTRTRGEKSEVAAAALKDGWMVAWVDERSGDPEVYVTKVGRALEQLSPEVRLTNAQGPASSLGLASSGERAVLAWTDARELRQPVPYAAMISTKDARVLEPARQLDLKAASAAALGLGSPAPAGGAALAAWIERSQEPSGPAALLLASLNADGTLTADPKKLAWPAGVPSGLALDCSSTSCRAVLATDLDGRTQLDGLDRLLEPGSPRRILSIDPVRPRSGTVALVGDDLFYADIDDAGRARVRRATLEW